MSRHEFRADQLRAESEGSSIPPEIYELMATVINFAQELNEAKNAPGS